MIFLILTHQDTRRDLTRVQRIKSFVSISDIHCVILIECSLPNTTLIVHFNGFGNSSVNKLKRRYL